MSVDTQEKIPDPSLTLAEISKLCGHGMPMPQASDHGRVFAEPWQAHAFAMTLQLHERGLFTWQDWADTLSAQITEDQKRGDPDDGQTYYHHWLGALEKMIVKLNIGTQDQIHELEHAWEDAAARTPHGQAIVLDPKDLPVS